MALEVGGLRLPDYYGACAIWRYDEAGHLSPVSFFDLPLSEETRSRLHWWWTSFMEAMSWPDPDVRGFKSDAAFDAFAAEGKELAKLIAEALGPEASLEVSLATPRFVRSSPPWVGRYRIFPEWGHASPVWNGVPGTGPYNLALEHLPITDQLAKELGRWQLSFLETLDEEYPPDSGFATPEEEEAFVSTGRLLARRFSTEIPDAVEVVLQLDQDWTYISGELVPPNHQKIPNLRNWARALRQRFF